MAKAIEKEGTVNVKLPKAVDGSPDFVTVAVNSKVYQIQRGVNVTVPRSVAEVLRNSEIAEEFADSFISTKAYQ